MSPIDILYGLGLILLFSLWIGVGIMGAARAKRGPCDCATCEPPRPEAHGCYEETETDFARHQRIRQAIARERAQLKEWKA